MGIRLRTLTKKSTLGFGKYKLYTVDTMLKTSYKMREALISSYYKLEAISYNDSVLTALKITNEYRINKPCKDIDMYNKFLKNIGKRPTYNFNQSPEVVIKKSKMENFGKRKLEVQSKIKLQNINHK